MGGLYDPALGPSNKHDICGTCGLNYIQCPGHLGHITLPLPVYHPVFFMHLYGVLRATCWNCHRFMCSTLKGHIFVGQLELIEHGLLMEAGSLVDTLRMRSEDDAADMLESSSESLVEIVQSYIEKCKREGGVITGSLPKMQTKNAIQSRKKKIEEFLQLCTKKVKKCVYCLAPMRFIRQEGRARIFHRELSKKNAETWKVAQLQELKRRRSAREMAGREGRSLEEQGGEDGGGHSEKEHSGGEGGGGHGNEERGGDDGCGASLTVEQLTKQHYLSPLNVREHVRELWLNQRTIMCALMGRSGDPRRGVEQVGMTSLPAIRKRQGQDIGPDDVFFLEVIPVPPSRFRPVSVL